MSRAAACRPTRFAPAHARPETVGATRSSSTSFDRVRARYEQFLADEEALDFHGLINRAAGHIRQGRWKPKYRYVLVDEFQDISAGRWRSLRLSDAGTRPTSW